MNKSGAGEEARLAALRDYQVLDTPPEAPFDRITRLAKTVLQMPIALVSLIDRDRQWFKSRQGFDLAETPRDASFCTHTIRQQEPLIVADASRDGRFAALPMVAGHPNVRYYIGIPLRTKDGHNIGALCAMDTKPRSLSSEQVEMLQDLARLVVDELELRLLASTDSLTGALTRGAFFDEARRDLMLANRHGRNLSCLLIDLDHFKSVNDSHGHGAGDLVLQLVVAAAQAELRGSDYIGRIGGEEFAIMLRETPLPGAFEIAERLRTRIGELVVAVAERTIRVTVSIGAAAALRSEASVENLVQRADEALYAAKVAGRNQTVCFGVTGADIPPVGSQRAWA